MIFQGDDSPVFVLGNPRSGTTFIRLILTCHSEIGIPPESEFIVKLFSRYGHINAFNEVQLKKLIQDVNGGVVDLSSQWKVDANKLLSQADTFVGQSYASVCANIYRGYQSYRGFGDVRLWGDKNNAYANYINVLNYLFPTARYIHVIRDGRAVLNSYQKLEYRSNQQYAPVLSHKAKSVALSWSDTVSRIADDLNKFAPNRHIAIMYEDVLKDFPNEISAVCEFLGLHYESSMLEFHSMNQTHELEPRDYEWKQNTFKPLDPMKSEAWRSELPSNDLITFDTIAHETLVKFGYECTSTPPLNLSDQCQITRNMLVSRSREIARAIRFKAVLARAKMGG